MADDTHGTPPMDYDQLAEIRQAVAETRAAMDAWYQDHPNPQWRREHPFDYDSMVANTYTYITLPALLAEIDRLRAREAVIPALREIAEEVAATPDEGGPYVERWVDDGEDEMFVVTCVYCGHGADRPEKINHDPGCLISRARTLLASLSPDK